MAGRSDTQRRSQPKWPVRLLRKIQGLLPRHHAKQEEDTAADPAAKITAKASWGIAFTIANISVLVLRLVIFDRQMLKIRRALADSSGNDQPQGSSGLGNPSRSVRLLHEGKESLENAGSKQKDETPADRAAKSTARATWFISFLTVGTIAVAVSQFIIFNGQLDEMRQARKSGDISMTDQIRVMQDQAKAMQKQVEVSRQALLANDRPWLQAVEFSVKKLQTDENNVVIGTDLKLKNVGHSPALDIQIIPVLISSLSVTEEASEIVRICRGAKNTAYSFYDSVLFPGEERTYSPNETLFILDIASVQRQKEDKVKKQQALARSIIGDGRAETEAQREMNLPLRDGLTLLGCVTYRSAIGGDVHATSFGLDLLRSCSEGPLGECAFEFSQQVIIPHGGLKEQPLLGASYAD